MSNEQMPKKVRQLLDLHGPGIPHISGDGKYVINVYPGFEGGPGYREGWRGWKDVSVVDTKTGQRWSERRNEREIEPPRRGLLSRLFG